MLSASEIAKLENIVFFDGVCGLCNLTVDSLLRIDQRKKLRFCPLQSEIFTQILSNLKLDRSQLPDSILFLKGGAIFYEAQAILEIGQALGGFYAGVARVGRLLPASWMRALYRLTARNRYLIFGKRDSCRLPTPEERERFLGV